MIGKTESKNPSNNFQLGFWSAALAAVFSIGFLVTGILGGSGLGILKLPYDPDIPDGFSLFLAWSFLIMMASIHRIVPEEEKKVWSQVGLSFATMYAAIVSIVYYVIITVVTPLQVAGQGDRVELLVFNTNGSLMQALDGLGYGMMSLATLFAAFAFSGNRLARYVKWSFIFNGLLAPSILLSYAPLLVAQPYYTAALATAALWAVSIPLATILVSLYFRRVLKTS